MGDLLPVQLKILRSVQVQKCNAIKVINTKTLETQSLLFVGPMERGVNQPIDAMLFVGSKQRSQPYFYLMVRKLKKLKHLGTLQCIRGMAKIST